MTSATVVGAGPNGLAAAASLASNGIGVTLLEATDHVGGGARSYEAIVPGLLHDHCSAIHPMAVDSPISVKLQLSRYGLTWKRAPLDCVHPLDDGSAGVLSTDVRQTALDLGADARVWQGLFGTTSRTYDKWSGDILGPMLRVPSHPLSLARFGLPGLLPATVLASVFRTERARALWAGVAAHAFQPLTTPLSSAIGLGILTAGHRHGWAVAAGGSESIAVALTQSLIANGGRIETGVRVSNLSDLPPSDVILFDLAPGAVARILGERLPPRVSAALRRFRHGPGAFKIDFAVHEGVPWRSEAASRAATVHLGGTLEEVAFTEKEVNQGRLPERPFVLVGQQYLADPDRSAGDVHPVWAYAHVPRGYAGDATASIIGQIERFAPGFRDRVVDWRVTRPSELEAGNANFVDGDILTGAKTPSQLIFGPRISARPYHLGVPGMYICSAATPPGPGAHGMCGAHAAEAALAYLGR